MTFQSVTLFANTPAAPTIQVVKCDECGALLMNFSDQSLHERWHETLPLNVDLVVGRLDGTLIGLYEDIQKLKEAMIE